MFLLYQYVKERRKEKKAERANHESAAKNAAAPIEPFMMTAVRFFSIRPPRTS